VAAALSQAEPVELVVDTSSLAPDLATAAAAIQNPTGAGNFADVMDALQNAPAPGARRNSAMMLEWAFRDLQSAQSRDIVLAITAPEGKAPLGRNLALDAAADQKLVGEVAMLALWTCAEAGAAGPAIGDRIRIVRALHAVGLDADARAFALEGLLALK
jgi:hypothetical protein